MNIVNRLLEKSQVWQSSRKMSHKVLILGYHRIGKVEKKLDPYSLSVSKENFYTHLKILKENFKVIRLSDFLDNKENKIYSDKSVIITFDDGYINNLTEALPLLEEFQMPATFFLTSGYFGKYFWWDILSDYIIKQKHNRLILQNIEFENKSKNSNILNEVSSFIRRLDYKQKLEILSEIEHLQGMDNESYRCMTREELRTLSSNPWAEIGGHTVMHFPLNSLTKIEQKNEILDNKKELEDNIKKQINLFAYPNGLYDLSTIDILGENSFNCGVTGKWGINDPASTPFELKRLMIGDWNNKRFSFLLKFWL